MGRSHQTRRRLDPPDMRPASEEGGCRHWPPSITWTLMGSSQGAREARPRGTVTSSRTLEGNYCDYIPKEREEHRHEDTRATGCSIYAYTPHLVRVLG